MLKFILAVFGLFLALLYLSSIEAQNKNKTTILYKIHIIRSLDSWMIKEILVREGQVVHKGQELLIIDNLKSTTFFENRNKEMKILLVERIKIKHLLDSIVVNEANLGNFVLDTVVTKNDDLIFPEDMMVDLNLIQQKKYEYQTIMQTLKSELSYYDEIISQAKLDIYSLEERIESLNKLYNLILEGLIAKQGLSENSLANQLEIQELKKEQMKAEYEISKSRLKISALKSELNEAMLDKINVALNFKAIQSDSLNRVESRLNELKSSTLVLKDNTTQTIIKSPVSGVFKFIPEIKIGRITNPYQGIAYIEIITDSDNTASDYYL